MTPQGVKEHCCDLGKDALVGGEALGGQFLENDVEGVIDTARCAGRGGWGVEQREEVVEEAPPCSWKVGASDLGKCDGKLRCNLVCGACVCHTKTYTNVYGMYLVIVLVDQAQQLRAQVHLLVIRNGSGRSAP